MLHWLHSFPPQSLNDDSMQLSQQWDKVTLQFVFCQIWQLCPKEVK